MPDTELVTGWCVDWCREATGEQIRKAFDLCGLVPREEYDVEKLHRPLSDIIKKQQSTDEWLSAHGDAVALERATIGSTWTHFEGKHSFQRAAHYLLADQSDFKVWRLQFVDEVSNILRSDEVTSPLVAEDELAAIKEGTGFSDCFLEFYALAMRSEIQVDVVLVDAEGFVTNRLEFANHFNEIIAFYVQTSKDRVYIPDDYDPTSFAVVEDAGPTRDSPDRSDESAGSDSEPADETENSLTQSSDDYVNSEMPGTSESMSAEELIVYEPVEDTLDDSFDAFMDRGDGDHLGGFEDTDYGENLGLDE